MFLIFVLFFIFLPLIELSILIRVGSIWGASSTILLIILTGVLGAHLARSQGLRVILQIQDDLQKGIMPAEKLLDGLLVLIAGLVLLTPGFVTDVLGFFVLWPQGRKLVRKGIIYLFQKKYVSAEAGGNTQDPENNTFTVDYIAEDE